jgi:hypothetical protein
MGRLRSWDGRSDKNGASEGKTGHAPRDKLIADVAVGVGFAKPNIDFLNIRCSDFRFHRCSVQPHISQ